MQTEYVATELLTPELPSQHTPVPARVIQVNKFHYLRGGTERYYFDVSEALRRRGYEVEHLSMHHDQNVAAGPRDVFVEGVDYRAPMSLTKKTRVALRAIYNREAALKASEIVGEGPRPIVHMHNIHHQLSPSIVREFARRQVPMVHTLHDYKLICPNAQMMTNERICERCQGGRFFEAVRNRCVLNSRAASIAAAIEAYLYRWADTFKDVARFLCPSRFLLEKMATFGIPRERLVHLPNFIPLDDYKPADPPNEKTCAFVGRLSHEKGIATLVDAITRLPDKSLKLSIIGDGPLRESLEEMARLRAPSQVQFLGYRTGSDLHDAIRRAAFVVVPSEWYENMPYSILECFALGRPVVGARIGGIPELVKDNVTGRLFTSGDVDSLAAVLQWMVDSKSDLLTMSRTARQTIEDKYSEAVHLARLTSIYSDVYKEAA